MRTLIITIGAVAIIIIGWFFLYGAIESNADDFINSLTEIAENINEYNWDMAWVHFTEVKNGWSKKRTILTIFIDHHEIDNIDLAMAKAQKYIQSKDKPLSLGEIEVLTQLFIIVKENESLSISNIL